MQLRWSKFAICLFLIVSTLAVYWQVTDHDFINYDDDVFVTENPYVKAGITKKGFIWALTTFYEGNWHPLTWLSHMLDCQLYGLKAGMHHLTNLLFHIANTLLLFLLLNRMTGNLWRSAFVAALFALHPIHVESVAWVGERKDVLSTLFWMLTMWAYVRYSERAVVIWYLLVLIFFALGLLAKPMLVTLPFVLLLMDCWPIGRLRLDLLGKKNRTKSQKISNSWLIYEKLPLFAMAGTVSVVTYIAAQKAGVVASLGALSLEMRIGNAIVCYIKYIRQMFWPNGLAVFYPHPGAVPIWQVAGAGLILTCLSIIFVRKIRTRPYLTVGWLWYLGSLVPVIGLVQGGEQAMADRYTYIPLIGLFIMIVWGVSDLLQKCRYHKFVLGMSMSLLLSVLIVCTWLQVRHWKEDFSLFTHALAVTDKNHSALNNLGRAFEEKGDLIGAIRQYSKSLLIKPYDPETHNNLGVALSKQGHYQSAIRHYSEALRLRPKGAETHNNMGNALAGTGRLQAAVSHYSEALRLRPDYADAYNNMGIALAMGGLFDDAIEHFRKALNINPDDARVRWNLEQALKEKAN